MNWAGKIIGGVLGLAAMGPSGGVLGAFIGPLFDAGVGVGVGTLLGGRADPAQVNALFFPTTFRVMGHIAKADGHDSEQEVASARGVMDAALRLLRGAIAAHPDLANFFVEIQLQAALAGDGLSELPRVRLRRVAMLLGL